MIKVAIYGEVLHEKHHGSIGFFFEQLEDFDIEYVIFEKFYHLIKPFLNLKDNIKTFNRKTSLKKRKIQHLISIGGDGTMLNSFQFVLKTDISVFGINTGRLGFLSNISTDKVGWALKELRENRFFIKKRSVLQVHYQGLKKEQYAINEMTIHKQDTSSMLTIHARINDYFLNSYWADGVMVSTPTGSTAYSLSCGGPILMPGSKNFIITPIAPHNLAVRPMVYTDDKIIELQVESRSDKFMLTFDSRSVTLPTEKILYIKKAPFYLSLLKFEDYNYLNLLRSKLMWGADKRN